MTTIRNAIAAAVATCLVVSGCSSSYEFDPVSVGDETSGSERRKSDSVFVSTLYVDLFGRRPESFSFEYLGLEGEVLFSFPIDELGVLLEGLLATGDSEPMRAILVDGLLISSEAAPLIPTRAEVTDPAEFIDGVFRQFLGREPSPWELRAFVDEWESDTEVTPRAVMRAVILSQEYLHR